MRLTKKAIETLEFRGTVVVLALVGALILYFSIYHGNRPPKDDTGPLPNVPADDKAPADRF